MYAAQRDAAVAAHELIKAGADLSAKDSNGNTALSHALKADAIDVMPLLIK